MNYIKVLQSKVAARDGAIEEAQQQITEFIAFLHSDKFTGVESDGGRKDWIATGDVIHQLTNLREALQILDEGKYR